MVDKAVTVPRAKLGARIGSVEASTWKLVTEAFRDFFDL